MAGSAPQKFIGTKRTALARSSGKSRRSSIGKRRYPFFAMCVDNAGDEVSLWVGKIYQVIKPRVNDGVRDVRVIDEDGEDYLYSADQFVAVELPYAARRAVVAASRKEIAVAR